MQKFFMALSTWMVTISTYAQDSLKTVELEEVGITAVRAFDKAPIPYANLSKKEIEEVYVGQHPIFFLERSTPGIYSYSESGSSLANYGQLRLRGIDQQRINFTLNGVPLNDMIDQGVFFSNFTDITSNFDNIQVQRGVGTSSNGVSSYGGSINFESINLRNKESFTNLELGVGSFETLRGNFQHFTGINEKGWGFMSGFSKLTSAGYKDNTSTDATSYFLTGGYYGDRDLLKWTLFTARAENGLGYSTIEESVLDQTPRFNNLSNNDTDDFRQFLTQLQYNRILNNEWTLGLTGYYGGAGGDFVTFGTNFPLENDHIGGILNANFEENNLTLDAGLHVYTFLRVNEESDPDNPANPFYREKSQKNEVSAFLKTAYDLGSFTFFGDLQLRSAALLISPDYHAVGIAPEGDIEYDWTFFNPKIGVTYSVDKKLELYTSFGRSGREPTKVDLFGGFRLDSTNYQSVRQGGVFEEEFVNDFEMGARFQSRKLAIDGNFYLMNFKNEIAQNGATLDFGVGAERNIPKSSRHGFEVSWTYLPHSRITFSGNVAYLNTKVKNLLLDGTPTRDAKQILSPDLILNAKLGFSPVDIFTLGVVGRYLDEQFMSLPNDPAFKVPSSFVVDLTAKMDITDSIALSLFVNNLMNEQYYTFGLATDNDGDGVSERGFFAQPKRNYFARLSISF